MTEPLRFDRRIASHAEAKPEPSEMRDFMLVLYRALRMITSYIEKRYGL